MIIGSRDSAPVCTLIHTLPCIVLENGDAIILGEKLILFFFKLQTIEFVQRARRQTIKSGFPHQTRLVLLRKRRNDHQLGIPGACRVSRHDDPIYKKTLLPYSEF